MLNKVILMDGCARIRISGRRRAVLQLPHSSGDRSSFYEKQTGEREADFINVSCWRQQAEFVSRYFHKGSMIIVEAVCETMTTPTRMV